MLKLGGTYQFLVFIDHINLLGESVHLQRITAALVVGKKIGLSVNAGKTKRMF